jgi:hypothetical protein
MSATTVESTTTTTTTSLGLDRAEKILPIVSIVLLLLVVTIYVILSWRDLFPAGPQNFCGPGLCADDIYSGQKTCPSSATSVVPFDPSFETCNPPTGCTSSEAPCLYYDPTIGTVCPGNPNFSSSCPSGVTPQDCGCTSRIFCPNFAAVYFIENTVTSPGVTELCTNFTSLVQETVWRDATGLPRNDLPISPGPSSGTTNLFCGVSQSQLGNVWPPNGCLRGTLILSLTDCLYYCASLPEGFACGSDEIPVRQGNGDFVCQANTGNLCTPQTSP